MSNHHDDNRNLACTMCGSPGFWQGTMVLRENKATGNKFYGCSMYPKCKNTLTLKQWDDRWYEEVIGDRLDEEELWTIDDGDNIPY